MIFKYFIAGIIFSQWLLPIGDSIASVLLSLLEAAKGIFSVKVVEYNNLIQDLTHDKEELKTHILGFQDPEEGEKDE